MSVIRTTCPWCDLDFEVPDCGGDSVTIACPECGEVYTDVVIQNSSKPHLKEMGVGQKSPCNEMARCALR